MTASCRDPGPCFHTWLSASPSASTSHGPAQPCSCQYSVVCGIGRNLLSSILDIYSGLPHGGGRRYKLEDFTSQYNIDMPIVNMIILKKQLKYKIQYSLVWESSLQYMEWITLVSCLTGRTKSCQYRQNSNIQIRDSQEFPQPPVRSNLSAVCWFKKNKFTAIFHSFPKC